MTLKTPDLFCSIAAQADNLGDIAIRQTFLDFFAEASVRVTVYTGDMPASYLDAYRLPTDVVMVSSPVEFAMRLLRSLLSRQRTHFGFAPGPFELQGGVNLAKTTLLLAVLTTVRLTSGQVVAVGRSVRGAHGIARMIQRRTVCASSIFVARDETTAHVLGMSIESAPDLGLVAPTRERPVSEEERRYVALSLRSDVDVSEDLLRRVVDSSRRADLIPIFVTQVKRDDRGHHELSERLETELCAWDDYSHSEQLARVEEVYGCAHTVISNRLHAIVFGVRRGAFPVALSRGPGDKVVTTMQRWVPLTVQEPEAADVAFEPHTASESRSERQALVAAVNRAVDALAEVRHRVLGVLSRI